MDVTTVVGSITHVSLITWILVVCTIVWVGVLRLPYSSNMSTKQPLPPSPRFSLPILGHLLRLTIDFRVMFAKYRKQFGDVYGLYMGSRYTVVIGGYQTIKEAFKTRSLFVDRPEMDLLDKISRKLGIAGVNGDVWREHRRFVLSTLKDLGRGRSGIGNKIKAETKLLVEAIGMEEGKPFDPKTLLTIATSNITCIIAFGKRAIHGDKAFKELITKVTQLNEATLRIGLGSMLPSLSDFPGDPLRTKQMLHDADTRLSFIRKMVDKHLKNPEKSDTEDYTSMFIKTMEQKHLNCEPTHFTLDQLSGVICDLFMAGSDTTATALRWSLVCLINFPETQTRMYDVINTHVGTDRLPSLEDKKALSYVEAFYLEVMRYCELRIVSFFYKASTDVELKGYTIPNDSVVVADLHSVWTDKQIWGDPENFRPGRFLNEEGTIRTQEESIPFFMGKRRCVGETLARAELFLFLSGMVQNYIFESPDDQVVSVRAVDGVFGVTHAPKPFRIIARARHK